MTTAMDRREVDAKAGNGCFVYLGRVKKRGNKNKAIVARPQQKRPRLALCVRRLHARGRRKGCPLPLWFLAAVPELAGARYNSLLD